MNIRARTTFMHGRTRFEAGQLYAVPEALGGYLIGVGWALPMLEPLTGVVHTPKLADLQPNAPDAVRKGNTLEVQDVHTTMHSPNVG